MACKPFDKLFKVLLSPDYLPAMRRRRSSDALGKISWFKKRHLSFDVQKLTVQNVYVKVTLPTAWEQRWTN
jgi:hypothetical protein